MFNDKDLKSINGYDQGSSDADYSANNKGCYLVISSPKDMEITTTFPLPYSHGFYVSGQGNTKSEQLDSIVDDVFSWRRCKCVDIVFCSVDFSIHWIK